MILLFLQLMVRIVRLSYGVHKLPFQQNSMCFINMQHLWWQSA